MKVDTNKEKIEELLTRGVEQIYPSADYLRARLTSGEKLKIYLGIDPTGPTLHLGHLIPLLKLRAFQELGHQIILLIGDFTATIGDPTGKFSARVPLSHEQVLENARLYKEQASRLVSFEGKNPAVLRHNSEWLAKLTFAETLALASKMTYGQTIKRDMFQKRIAEGRDLYLHEFLYPLMQGYDSVAMDVDGEIGGSDQTFNMLVGRDLLKKIKGKEKFVVAMRMLVDSAGAKMGKTEGNMVALSDSPDGMYGKVMSWNDDLIIPGLELCTDASKGRIEELAGKLSAGLNPRDAKMTLAREVVGIYHGKPAAEAAEKEFVLVFQKKKNPEGIPAIRAGEREKLSAVLLREKIVKSASEFRRLIDEGAISANDGKINDPGALVGEGGVFKVGKKRFIKIN